MKRLWLATAAGAALLVGAGAAQAVPITGELSLNGSDTFTSTSISFLNPGNIGGTTGAFTVAFGVVPPQITGVVAFSDFTNASSNFQLYTATALGETTTLVAAAITSFIFTPGSPLESLDIKGTGTLTLTGTHPFDATPGNWELTTQGPGGTATVTFSETSIAAGVPEPSSLFLLGTGLVGLFGLFGWRRRRLERSAAFA